MFVAACVIMGAIERFRHWRRRRLRKSRRAEVGQDIGVRKTAFVKRHDLTQYGIRNTK